MVLVVLVVVSFWLVGCLVGVDDSGWGAGWLLVAGYINLGRVDDLSTAEARTVEAMQQRAWEVLDEAWRLGIRYFDPWPGGQCWLVMGFRPNLVPDSVCS